MIDVNATAQGDRAFSLIEVIGALAVAAVLSAGIALVSIRSIDQAVSCQEATNLQNLANALQNSILRTRYIPGTNDWYQVIATELGASTNAVLLTSRNTRRAFLIDPNLQIGASSGVLPYAQGTNGSPPPQSPRLLILSSLAGSAPLPASGIIPANFGTLWNTADGSLPTNTSFSGWQGLPEDLRIQRVDLNSLFVKLQLSNLLSTNQGQYLIDGRGPASVPGGTNGLGAYFIRNTVLTLCTGASSGGGTNAELILSRDMSLFYLQQVWRDVPFVMVASQTNTASANMANMITMAASMFVNSPGNLNALNGVTPPQVLNQMSNFMSAYVPYAAYAASYSATNGGSWPITGTLHDAAKNAQTALYNDMSALANNLTPYQCSPAQQ
jgi:prepilin-type N-terminal cleavage/methylation domain-containing protein